MPNNLFSKTSPQTDGNTNARMGVLGAGVGMVRSLTESLHGAWARYKHHTGQGARPALVQVPPSEKNVVANVEAEHIAGTRQALQQSKGDMSNIMQSIQWLGTQRGQIAHQMLGMMDPSREYSVWQQRDQEFEQKIQTLCPTLSNCIDQCIADTASHGQASPIESLDYVAHAFSALVVLHGIKPREEAGDAQMQCLNKQAEYLTATLSLGLDDKILGSRSVENAKDNIARSLAGIAFAKNDLYANPQPFPHIYDAIQVQMHEIR